MAGMTVAEKVGSLLVARVVCGPGGTLWEGTEGESPFGFTPTTELIRERHITHVTLMNPAPVPDLIAWGDRLQQLAATTRSKQAVSIAADPVHGQSRNAQVAMSGGGFTVLPEPIGLAATRDPALVREAARMMGRELRAAGITVALHPMADLATEPRWARVAGTFGEDPELVAELAEQYILGLQEAGVAATVKHFPGGGPQQGGEDSHFERGAHTVYPGGAFETHLAPFARAIRAGVSRVMPGYAAPVGTDYAEVGFAFERALMTDVLRNRLGFTGIILTDFNIVQGMSLPRLGVHLAPRAWGLEQTTALERVVRLFDAGVDQFGGEDDPAVFLEALDRGLVSEQRLDDSVRRVLLEKARLGVLTTDDLEVERAATAASTIEIAGADHQRIADRVRRASVVALAGSPVRLTPETRVYAEGVARAAVAARAVPVDSPDEAEVAIVRIAAPFEPREGLLEQAFHQGSLAFPEETVRHIADLAARVPTVVDVFLERPAVLTPLAELPVTLLGSFGVADDVLLDAASGRASVRGRLPFDIPRSMDAVRASREDVPFDTQDPLFPCGHGLVWGE